MLSVDSNRVQEALVPRRRAGAALFIALASSVALTVPASGQQATDLRGAWEAERYVMAEGGSYDVRGRIIFTDRDWQVLFFVRDADGALRRGSAEGGTYDFRDGQLVFSHLHNLSVGDAMPGLPAAELRMVARDPADAVLEPTDIRVEDDVLTLAFPSGNRMTFRRR